MCGINGFIDAGGASSREERIALLRRMTDTLRHRGPDDAGWWMDATGRVALGHRRLSVVDLSPQGHQPMVSACGRYVLVFNGEIYNFLEIRRELEEKGHSFRGNSDTEVMLASFSEWGVEASLARFNGMFAFAAWDAADRALVLARDRVGIKPLYYGAGGGAFLFASELRAVRAHPAFRGDIDRDALCLFMRYGYVPGPRTIYSAFRKLPPGTFLRARSGEVSRPVTYWSALEVARHGNDHPFSGTEVEAIDALDALLGDAVARQMIADVPLGAFLSGGIDSSTVVALMQSRSSSRVRTFCVGFEDPAYDESAHARAVARHLGTDHTELHVTEADALELVPRMTEWYDEPFADPSQLPTYLVSALTRKHVTVSLSGDGGDELFAGYPRYPWSLSLWERSRRMPRWLRLIGDRAVRSESLRVIARLASGVSSDGRLGILADKVLRKGGVLFATDPAEIYRRVLSHWDPPTAIVRNPDEPGTAVEDEAIAKLFASPLSRFQLVDLVMYLPDDILTKVDRASMAVGLEARVPLLDHLVVELAWRFPERWRIRDGEAKWILRRVLQRYVPLELFDRPKMGFGAPIGAWLRGVLRDWAEALLDERRIAADGHLSADEIRRAWRDHLSGRADHQYMLWNVLTYLAWRRGEGA